MTACCAVLCCAGANLRLAPLGRVHATTLLEVVVAQLQVTGFALREDAHCRGGGGAPAEAFREAASLLINSGVHLLVHVHSVLGDGVSMDSRAFKPSDTATSGGRDAARRQQRGGEAGSRGRGARRATTPVELAHNAGRAVARALGAGRLTEVYAAAAHGTACSLLDLCCATTGPLAEGSELQQGGDGPGVFAAL